MRGGGGLKRRRHKLGCSRIEGVDEEEEGEEEEEEGEGGREEGGGGGPLHCNHRIYVGICYYVE